MKMTEELKKAQANMQPGEITADGFLGRDNHPLADLIQHDEEEMRRCGLDWDQTAAQLRDLLLAGEAGLGEPVTVGRWLVRTDEARGKLPCPWEDGLFRKINAEVWVQKNGQPQGEPVIYNELCLHLMEHHHFLQGPGSPFRLDPETLKNLLV